jgi:hypothetical protein
VPESEVYPRFIPGENDSGPFALFAPEGVDLKAFDRVHVVFALAGSALIRSSKMGEEMCSQVQEEEMPCSFLAQLAFAVEALFIVDGGGMVFPIACVDREAVGWQKDPPPKRP